MSERKIRGRVINGYLDFVKRTWGQDGYEECRKAVGIGDAAKIEDGEFYPNNAMLTIIKWIAENHGKERVKQAGKHTVKNLGLFAYLVRFMTMETMLNKAVERYREMYQFGSVDIKMKENGATAIMRDVTDIKENCIGWTGAFEAMLELTKTKGSVREVKCQNEGDDHCEFEIIWS